MTEEKSIKMLWYELCFAREEYYGDPDAYPKYGACQRALSQRLSKEGITFHVSGTTEARNIKWTLSDGTILKQEDPL